MPYLFLNFLSLQYITGGQYYSQSFSAYFSDRCARIINKLSTSSFLVNPFV